MGLFKLEVVRLTQLGKKRYWIKNMTTGNIYPGRSYSTRKKADKALEAMQRYIEKTPPDDLL